MPASAFDVSEVTHSLNKFISHQENCKPELSKGERKRSSPTSLPVSRGAPLPLAADSDEPLYPGNAILSVFRFLFLSSSIPGKCEHSPDTGAHCQDANRPDRRLQTLLSRTRPISLHRDPTSARPKPLPSLESRAGEGRTSCPQQHHDFDVPIICPWPRSSAVPFSIDPRHHPPHLS